MKVRTHVSQKPRKRLVLSDFKGVDFSSSPFRVSHKRASNMRNLINEYGVNHKRKGWRQVKKFAYEYRSGTDGQGEALYSTRDCRVNGIFEYRHGTHSVVLIHAGTKMFRLDNSRGISTDIKDWTDITPVGMTLSDERSQAFYSKGRLYITGCGDYLAYGTWDDGESYQLRSVYGAEDTYVPTTSLSINHDGDKADTARAKLEDVNMLTPWRKNRLLGASLVDKVEETVTKDEDPEADSDGDGIADNDEDKEEKVTTEVQVESRTWTLDGAVDENTRVTVEVSLFDNGEERVVTLTNNETELSDSSGEYKGEVDFKKGRITLSFDTSPLRNEENITVTFSSTTEGYAQRIKNCKFGVLFGADGYTDRIFLSGNPELPNVDFHSEPDDFTYFPDDNYAAVGSDASAIKGYVRLADSTLVIFKEEYMNEPSLFFRTGTTRTEYNSAGDITDMYGLFPSVAGSLGETLISRHTTANFGSDCLMLSQNGVYGVVLGDNARTTERYTRERSRTINEHLKGKSLKDAVAVVYQNKYYLAVDGVCYVADARFTSGGSDSLDGAYNYEWWYWDNIPARVFAVIDDELYFGTADGMLCKFDGEYTDRTYVLCEEGELSITPGEKAVIVDESLLTEFAESDRITFSSNAYALWHSGVEIERERDAEGEPTGAPTGRLVITEDELDEDGKVIKRGLIHNIFNGIRLYGDKLPKNCGIFPGVEYVVVNVDRGALTFMLARAADVSDGDILDVFPEQRCAKVTEGGFDLTKNKKNSELRVILNINEFTDKVESIELKEYEKDEETLTWGSTDYKDGSYDAPDEDGALSGIITFRRPVVAEWYTPILDMGTNMESKTLLGITVCTEPETNGKLTFGYETRTVNRAMSAKGLHVFSFDNLSFENFSFECGFASSYTVRTNERDFNFMIFRFISDNDTDCAVNDITLVYKINRKNIGVR